MPGAREDGGLESFERSETELKKHPRGGSVLDPNHELHPLCGIVAKRIERGGVFKFLMASACGMGVDTISITPAEGGGMYVEVDNSLGHPPSDIACDIAADLVRPDLDREIDHLLDGVM